MRFKKVLTVLPILLFSALFGFFLWQIYFQYNNPGYKLTWQGSWITSTQLEGDIFYFRKEFNISHKIKNAWLLISASDNFEVYLNGERLGSLSLEGWFPSDIYNVTNKVHLGINVVALRVEKRSFEGPVKSIIDLGYEDINGSKHYIVSDESWKLSNKEEKTSQTGLLWYEKGFHDVNWMNAEKIDKSNGLWSDIDPRIYTYSPNRTWFWGGKRKELSCKAEIDVPKKPKTAWIRIGSRGGFRLLVNNKQIGGRDDVFGLGQKVLTTAVQSNGAPSSDGIKEIEKLGVYEVGQFLKAGLNNISIFAYGEGPRQGLYIDGFFEVNGWNKRVNETDFTCIYSGYTNSSRIYHDTPGWLGLRGIEINEDMNSPLTFTVLMYSKLALIIFICSVVFIGITFFIRGRSHHPFYLLSRAYFLPLLFLLFIYILQYDPRVSESFPYQSIFLVVSLCLLVLVWLINPLIARVNVKKIPAWIITLAFVLILTFGAFLRFNEVTQESLHWDEAQMSVRSQGVLDRGYPSSVPLPDDEAQGLYITTSELVAYIQALSFVSFGKNEFSIRFHSVVFGIFTIALIYFFGKMIWGVRVGLLASATFSLLPAAIGMANFGRYQSQLAFFALLTGYFAFLYFKTEKVRYWYLCAVSFLFIYFTWQGSLLFLFPLVMMLLIMGRREKIFKDIFILFIIIGPPLTLHFLIRTFQFVSHVSFLYGRGVSSLTPKLMFLHSTYDPFYYINKFFFIEGYQFISILFFAGIPFVFSKFKKYRELICLYLPALVIPFLMSNTLEISNYRYAFYVLPYLILSASCVLFLFLDYLGNSKEYPSINFMNAIFASIFLIVVSTGLFFNFKKFPVPFLHGRTVSESIKTNTNLRHFPPMTEASEFVKANKRPGDIIVSYQPHLHEFYLGKVDYFFESSAITPLIMIPKDSSFIFLDRIIKTPAIITLEEFRRFMASGSNRIWLIGTPEPSYDANAKEFIQKNMKLVFERFNTKVYLREGKT